MDESKINNFIVVYGQFFGPDKVQFLKSSLNSMSDDKLTLIQTLDFKNPSTILILAIFGLSRFMLGQVGIGILQLITFGGMGIWYLIDIINSKKNTYEYNFKQFQKYSI